MFCCLYLLWSYCVSILFLLFVLLLCRDLRDGHLVNRVHVRFYDRGLRVSYLGHPMSNVVLLRGRQVVL